MGSERKRKSGALSLSRACFERGISVECVPFASPISLASAMPPQGIVVIASLLASISDSLPIVDGDEDYQEDYPISLARNGTFFDPYYDYYYDGANSTDPCRCAAGCLQKPEWRPPNYDPLSKYLWDEGKQPKPGQLIKALKTQNESVSNGVGRNSKNKTVLKFGFLVEIHYPSILGSVALAVDAVNADESILPGVTLDYIFERVNSQYIACITSKNTCMHHKSSATHAYHS